MPKGEKQTRRSLTNKSGSPILRCKKPALRATNNAQTDFIHLCRHKRLFLTENDKEVKFNKRNICVEEAQEGEEGTTWVDLFLDKGTSVNGRRSALPRSNAVLAMSQPSDNPYLVTLTQKTEDGFMVLNKDSNKQKLSITRTPCANSSDSPSTTPGANSKDPPSTTPGANSNDPPSTKQALGQDLERHLFVMNIDSNGRSLSFQCYKNKAHVLHVSEDRLAVSSSKPASSFTLRIKASEQECCTCIALNAGVV
ncbi:uncharacterized protein [Tiliqua scincoides]